MAKKIVSYNVNGLRSAMQKGLHQYLKAENFDIVCFQETKVDQTLADPDLFKDLGYTSYWHCAEKKGYSGVMVLAKEQADQFITGCGMEEYDKEGRIIRLDFGEWTIVNCYFPSGSISEERHSFKMKFLQKFYPWVLELLSKRKKLILVGDYNIVHKDLDIHNPERKDNPSGFRPEERAWLDQWFKDNFDDAFRCIHPNEKAFSWWSYRAGSYGKDKGWRIDYQSISKPFGHLVKDFKHHREIRFSDHCPIEAQYQIF